MAQNNISSPAIYFRKTFLFIKYRNFIPSKLLRIKLFFCFSIIFIFSLFVFTRNSNIDFSENENYCKINNIIHRRQKDFNRITLVLHSSYDRIDKSIKNQIENWNAPISLAIVFSSKSTEKDIYCLTSLLKRLCKKYLNVANNLSVHYLIHQKHDCKKIKKSLKKNNKKCRNCFPEKGGKKELDVEQLIEYPINLARNYARKMSSTKYILMADMDHYFSENFQTKMLSLANAILEMEPKTVLVYRIFEIKEEYFRIKETKKNLRKLLQQNKARQFHEYFNAHVIPRLVEWIYSEDQGPNKTSIQFYKKYTDNQWEPQFVSLTNIPFHDESFKYPMRDNTVLRWEMCRAGYQFAIINDVFMYHPGFKRIQKNDILDNARNSVLQNSIKALDAFKLKMDQNYPDAKNICPEISSLW